MFTWLYNDLIGIIYLIFTIITIAFSIYLFFNYLRKTAIFQLLLSGILFIINTLMLKDNYSVDKTVFFLIKDGWKNTWHVKVIVLLNIFLILLVIMNLSRLINYKMRRKEEKTNVKTEEVRKTY